MESYKDLPRQKKNSKGKAFLFRRYRGLPNKIRLGSGELSLSMPMPMPMPLPVEGYCHDIKNIRARLLIKCCQLTSAPQIVGLAGSQTKLPLYCSTCNLGNPLISRFSKTFICFYCKLLFYHFYIFRLCWYLKKIIILIYF